jgi:hypothetical protein
LKRKSLEIATWRMLLPYFPQNRPFSWKLTRSK